MEKRNRLDKLFQDAFLEVFVNKVVIHTEREINRFVDSLNKSLAELDKKLKEYALDRLVKDDLEVFNFKINQEATATKSRIYEELNKAILQQREFAKVVDFLTGMIASALESYPKEQYPTYTPEAQPAQPFQNIPTTEIPQAPIQVQGPQIDASQRILQEITKQMDDLNRENQELRTKNKQLLQQLKGIEKAKKITEEKLKKLEEDIRERDDKIKQVLVKLMEYKKRLEELKEIAVPPKPPEDKTKLLEQQLNSLRAEYVMATDKNERLVKRLEELNQKIKMYEEENERLKQQISQQHIQNEKIVAELEKVKNVLVRLKKEKNSLERQAAKNITKATEFDKLIMQISVLDEFMKNNPQYAALRILSSKISEGVFEVSADELGYHRDSGISLAAWLTNIFGHLKDMGLVDFRIDTSQGYPRGFIVVTDKGKKIFIELRNKLFS